MTQEKNAFINPTELFDPRKNGFSHIAKVPSGKELYYFSGQWGSDRNGKLVSLDFEEQVRRTVQNIKAALSEVGLTINDVVKQAVYIADFTIEKKQILIAVAAQEWKAENFPASSVIPLPVLATVPNCLIEIEIIAAK
ncbi:Enamine deaminase RidA, house cleaning of reactive enamine intermediates, YjgF/YER057c/UK114 family [Spirosomataceae bacterium TFI 002]|nr:Enamine deaminase RidA, house cleaning of reactive enamine intermediates, YjgF/YER057c/UK114 family [Spirosomataceae bacterium TFI 002]